MPFRRPKLSNIGPAKGNARTDPAYMIATVRLEVVELRLKSVKLSDNSCQRQIREETQVF